MGPWGYYVSYHFVSNFKAAAGSQVTFFTDLTCHARLRHRHSERKKDH